MALEAATALNELIQRATVREVVVGGRAPVSADAQEQPRPYFRIRHLRMGDDIGVPGLAGGLVTVTCHARSEVEAFAEGVALSRALGLHYGPIIGPSPELHVITIEGGWTPAADPKGGAAACSISYQHA